LSRKNVRSESEEDALMKGARKTSPKGMNRMVQAEESLSKGKMKG